MLDDGISTITSEEQNDLERRVRDLYASYAAEGVKDDDERLYVRRQVHAKYLAGGLGELPAGFSSLDASRPWICFWILHSLALLEQPLPKTPSRESILAFLSSCQHSQGGFGGGPHQLPHLATTYAAVAALVTLGGADALSLIDREGLITFLLDMCVPGDRGGGMTMHQGGEVDVRGCYCALATCHMLGMDQEKERIAIACSLELYVAACQSQEGGIGGEPWNEAHGGYTFCGYAALVLANRASAVDGARLRRWAARMQGWMEGGFMGRTNKLVDGCYSLWQGGIFPLISNSGSGSVDSEVKKAGAVNNQSLQNDPVVVAALHAAAEKVAQRVLKGSGRVKKILQQEVDTPRKAAQKAVERAEKALEDAVEDSLALEQALEGAKAKGAPAPELEALKRKALEGLQKAGDAQDSINRAKQHEECAAVASLEILDKNKNNGEHQTEGLLYNARALQLWLLVCCQMTKGGLRDKPGKHADYYHTCYCLSGLSSSQHASGVVLGGERNRLAAADPLCNVVVSKVEESRAFFFSS